MGNVTVKLGGIFVSRAAARLGNEVCARLRAVNGTPDASDYVVDLCFLTYVPDGIGAEGVAGTGIRPGMVGRQQRRFIINVEVPPDLADAHAYDLWMVGALSEAAAIVRNHLPAKGKAYPAERLADELDALRARWSEHLAAAC